MNTVKLLVPYTEINSVIKEIKQSGVKYYPIRKLSETYKIEMENHSIASFLVLKYGLDME